MILLKNCILFLEDLTDLSDLLIVKNSIASTGTIIPKNAGSVGDVAQPKALVTFSKNRFDPGLLVIRGAPTPIF